MNIDPETEWLRGKIERLGDSIAAPEALQDILRLILNRIVALEQPAVTSVWTVSPDGSFTTTTQPPENT